MARINKNHVNPVNPVEKSPAAGGYVLHICNADIPLDLEYICNVAGIPFYG